MQSQLIEAGWQFYDFEKNWDVFYKVWNSDKVQNFINEDINNWCWGETYHPDLLPKWLQNEPKWYTQLTADYIPAICTIANKKIQNKQMVFHYKNKKKKDHTRPYIKITIDDIREEF